MNCVSEQGWRTVQLVWFGLQWICVVLPDYQAYTKCVDPARFRISRSEAHEASFTCLPLEIIHLIWLYSCCKWEFLATPSQYFLDADSRTDSPCFESDEFDQTGPGWGRNSWDLCFEHVDTYWSYWVTPKKRGKSHKKIWENHRITMGKWWKIMENQDLPNLVTTCNN